MPFVKGLITAVKITNLTYRLVSTTVLLGYTLVGIRTVVRRRKAKLGEKHGN